MKLIERMKLRWWLWRNRKQLKKAAKTYFIWPIEITSDELYGREPIPYEFTFDITLSAWGSETVNGRGERDFDIVQ